MNVQKAEIYVIRLPLLSPFRTGFGTISERELVFVSLYDKSGIVGIGESANLATPVYEPEYNNTMIVTLQKHLIPLLLNTPIHLIEDLERTYAHIRGNNFAKAAIEAAYWHIVSQQTHKPLRKLWGGVKKSIPVAISIGLGTTIDDSIKKVRTGIETHHPTRAKIKIKPGIDVKLIHTIRKLYPDLPLMVDANASYTVKDVAILKKLDAYGLLMIEQPLAYNDLVDHAWLQKQIRTPICLDESIREYHDAEQAIKLKSCRIINIKPQRVGGYWRAKQISKLCDKHHIPVWCGGMIESGWGQLYNCHIATLANYTYDNDICLTKWYLADDILAHPIQDNAGYIDVSTTDGLFSLDSEKFHAYTKIKIHVEQK
jgi:O-succinylbenzoate synthase